MSTIEGVCIGVDISKDTLDVHIHPEGLSRAFDNALKGFKALAKWLSPYRQAKIVFEPTGAYHKAFERWFGSQGWSLAKANPRQVRRFAQAIGKPAKTDKLDAMLLARMGALLDLPCRAQPSETLVELKELSVAREALVKDRTMAKNRTHIRLIPLLKRQAKRRLEQIEADLKAIEQAMADAISADPDLCAKLAILLSIPGVGNITAMAMLIEMPELGQIENKCVASLAGLAPIARESGTWKGKRFIHGGRANLRKALYMPTLVAVRCNPDLKATHDRLIKAGKPSKVAIVAAMRKLIVLANALLRKGANWTPALA